MAKRKTYSASFKSKVALEAIRGDTTIAELASKYGVNPVMVTRWKKQAVDGMAETFSKRGQASRDASHEARIKELHAKIGELTVERDFLSKAFGR
jgi:transposase